MEIQLSTLPLRLPQGATIRLEAARGVVVRVRSGRLWLTEQGLPEDLFVGPGEAVRLRGNGRVVVQADESSCIELAGLRTQWHFTPRRRAAVLAAAPLRAMARAARTALAHWRRGAGWMPVPPPSALLR